MGIVLLILAIVFVVISFVLGKFWSAEILPGVIPLVGVVLTFALFISGIIVSVEESSKLNRAETSFSDSAYSVFEVIRQTEDSLPNGNPNQFGKIFLQDASTLIVTSSNKNLITNAVGKNFNAKGQYLISIKLSNPDYILTGSLTADNKNWCFDIKEGKYETLYNQNGFVINNFNLGLKHSSCLDGVAYNTSGQAILGSTNPNNDN